MNETIPSPAPELDAWLDPVAVSHHLVERPWGRLHLVSAGPPEAPGVVLVHGWPQHWFAWRHVIAALAPTTRVVAIDLRAMGWSTPTRSSAQPSTADLADDIVAAVNAVGLDRPLLVGHDWGGWAGFRAVLDHPDVFGAYVAMSILAPWVSGRAMLRNFLGWAYVFPLATFGHRIARSPRMVRALLDRSTTAHIWGHEGGGSLALASYQQRLSRPEVAATSRHLYADFLRSGLPRAVGPRSPRLAVPTTMLIGEHETITRPEVFCPRTLPGELRVVTVPGARHWLAEEAPDHVAAAITAMLTVDR